MDNFFQFALLCAVIIIIVVLILVIGKVFTTRISAINKRFLEELTNEMRTENANLKAELAAIKENLISINKMMKEIE